MYTFEDGNISIVRGDTGSFDLVIITSNGETFNWKTGDKLYFTVKEDYDSSEAKIKKVYSLTGTMGTSENPLVIALTASDTENLESGTYVYDFEADYADADNNTIIDTFMRGNFIIWPDVTTSAQKS